MRVVVVHQEVAPEAPEDERDVLTQAQTVAEALRELGHEAIVVSAGTTPVELRTRVRELHPDVVFNLVESVYGSDRFQYLAARVLEELSIPFTGNGSRALLLTGDKRLTKLLLAKSGVPTPRWICGSEIVQNPDRPEEPRLLQYLEEFHRIGRLEGDIPSEARFLLKSAWAHASAGLVERLWEASRTEQRERIQTEIAARTAATGEPWFAEEYIDGREFNLSLLGTARGPVVLPPAEIDFSAFSPRQLRIVGYRAKWDPDSFEYRATPRRFEFPSEDSPLLHRLNDTALACWRLFGLAGYARVDFRVDPEGTPYVLEINANPCLSPDAGFPAAAVQAGRSFAQLVGLLLEDALARSRAQT
ncbi:hypothetical protein [Thermogutta sp.]|uniref:D-alanine--D-alanine ligase family protein n=1 Tax=Thermogutta sp. TaxID=1962930 RepID=UPI00321FEB9D